MIAFARPAAGAALAALLTFPGLASAQELAIDGAVAHPLHLALADLKAMPPTGVDVTFQTSHGQESGHYVGVLLWTVMQQAGLADTSGGHPDLRHTLTIAGRDGYKVALAFGEIDPDFADKQVIVAYGRDGDPPMKPEDGLRLIVPGDKHGARDVRDVVEISVN